ncbi:hypothetical protein HK102_005326, partial [Quaeritorhiza haematococci]
MVHNGSAAGAPTQRTMTASSGGRPDQTSVQMSVTETTSGSAAMSTFSPRASLMTQGQQHHRSSTMAPNENAALENRAQAMEELAKE